MNLRLFAALDPPGPVRRRLAGLQDELRRSAGHRADLLRWIPADRLHVTLQFLGAVPEERAGAVREAMEGAAAGSRPLALEVRGAGGFPSSRRSRVVWLGLEGDRDGLAALAADLGRRLAPLGFPPEERPLAPHFTIGRSRDGRGAPGLGGAVAGAATARAIRWRADELSLLRSHLLPGGARYEVLARFPLGPFRDDAAEN
ncbi:MAG: RNA 2',3'-cyclic phosphodiesterase [Deltaproteobacteria bacterium]|nr:RNA 2',3'-cyclic phosphodiesterase [Deltaproteobacteria bacterium]